MNIYWSYCDAQHQIRAEEPIPILKNYWKDKRNVEESGFMHVRCPAFKDMLQNTFGIKSLYDYNLEISKKEAVSTLHDQEFFDKFIVVRDLETRLISFLSSYIFIAEDNDLEMEILPSVLENNKFNKTSMLLPATFNIGKYIRPIECAFHCRDDNWEIEEEDIYSYVKFKTDKKINFKRFVWDEQHEKVVLNAKPTASHTYRKKILKPLDWYYKKQQGIKTKQRMLELVKKTLV